MRKIDATINPPLYYLNDMLNDPIEEGCYREQLFKINIKEDPAYEVEKVLFEKKVNNKVYCFVKFLYYSSKFNMFVLKKDLIKGKD